MGGAGYTISDVNNLMNSLKTGVSTFKGSMQESWGPLTQSFRNEWVGEDEAAFEKTFANELGNMFLNCQNVINTAGQFIHNAADAWMQYQMQTASSLGGDGGQISGLDDFSPSDLSLEIVPTEQSFDPSVRRGLQSDSSESTLVTAIDEYVNSVKNSLQNIQTTLETGNAFVGAEQKPAIDQFIGDVITSAQTVTKMVDGFKTETIPALVRGYQEQQSSTSSATTEQKSSIESAVNEVVR